MKIIRIILTFLLSLLLSTLITPNANAQTPAKRLCGQNRYQTAIAISKEGWKQSDYAIIAYGENYPDAIAAAPLAMKYDAPILLTEKDNLTEDTKQELIRLGTQNVFVVGGTGVITPDVESQLISLNINVTRLAGNDRYETAVKIAEMLGNPNEVMIATGDDFPDALSVAPAAAKMGIPILLIQPNRIPESVNQYINSKSISKAYIVGDETIVSSSTEKQLPFLCESIYGIDRYETNHAAITKFQNILNSSMFYVATGEDYADALTGSVLAAKNDAPLLYIGTEPWQAAGFICNYIGRRELSTNYITPVILGGVGAVNSDAENILNNYTDILQKAKNQTGFGKYVYIGQVMIAGDWVYYNRMGSYPWDEGTSYGENAVYMMKLDGSENTRVFFVGKDVNNYTFDYIEEHATDFINNENITITDIQDNWIYYNVCGIIERYNGNYKVRIDGTQNQEV